MFSEGAKGNSMNSLNWYADCYANSRWKCIHIYFRTPGIDVPGQRKLPGGSSG
jgi:hypothetical protein